MKEREAVAVAIAYARENGYDPELYEANAQKQDADWHISFYRKTDGNKPVPGDFFTVIVSDGAFRLIPGK